MVDIIKRLYSQALLALGALLYKSACLGSRNNSVFSNSDVMFFFPGALGLVLEAARRGE